MTVTSLVANPSGVVDVEDCEIDLETKKLSSSTANSSCLVDCEIVDVEDNEDEACDAPVPMFVKHTEAMLDEIDRMVCVSYYLVPTAFFFMKSFYFYIFES